MLAPAPALLLADDMPGSGSMGKGMMGEHMAEKRVDHLTQKLQLTADQQTQVKKILGDSQAQLKPLMDQMKSIHQQTDEKIEALLTPDQKKKCDEMKAERQAKMKERWEHQNKSKK